MRRCLGYILLLLLFVGSAAAQEILRAKCIGVIDGDTIRVLHKGKSLKVRLEGIDCPELGQDFGRRARQFTSSQVSGRFVTVTVTGLDQHGRKVGRVSSDGRDLSLLLVEAGLAWHYVRHSSDRLLADAEKKARSAGKGLWSMRSPIPPWRWRRAKP